jgi:2-polyprenyl-3-methyl-5-hydroxy-6-metoxy-1,4-benzoquinol methylase
MKRLDLISEYLTPGESKILDGGCGEGEYVLAMRDKYNVEVWGIEYLEHKVKAFETKHPGLNWVSKGDLQDITYADDTFNVVILNEVLEHVPDDAAALQEVHRVLMPGGIVIIFSPNRLFPFESHGVYTRNSNKKLPPYIPLVPYIPLALGKKGFRYWARNYWPYELRGMVAKTGFDIIETKYLWQTFENISGVQPVFIGKTRSILRKCANILEKIPFLQMFGISQVIVAQKKVIH